MTLKQMMMLAGAGYLVGKMANSSGINLAGAGQKLRGIAGKDVSKYVEGWTDDALDRAGLVRKSKVKTGGAAAMIAGMGTGILVGAGLALLFAPKSGAETRQMIGERVKTIRERNGGRERPYTSPETTGAGPQTMP